MLLILAFIFGLLGFGCLSDKGISILKPIGLGMIGIALIFCGLATEKIATTGLGGCIIVISVLWGMIYSQNEKDGTNSQKRAAELDEINREYQEALASQQSNTPWTVKYATEPCPYCGHYKVRSAKWDDKKMSVAFWGAASGKLGKSFKCDHCKQMW